MSHSTISLPNVRAHQLRLIAEEMDCTATDFLDDCISYNWEMLGHTEAGYLPPFDLSVGPDDTTGLPRVFVVYPGTPILDVGLRDAHRLAAALISAASPGKFAKVIVPAASGGEPAGFVVDRKGRGVRLRIADRHDGAPRTLTIGLTPTVAKDLATALVVHADRALAAAEAAA